MNASSDSLAPDGCRHKPKETRSAGFAAILVLRQG